MIEVKLPCEIGVKIKDNENGFEGRILGYRVIGGNPLLPPRVMAEVHDSYEEDNVVFVVVYDGVFANNIEVIGY